MTSRWFKANEPFAIRFEDPDKWTAETLEKHSLLKDIQVLNEENIRLKEQIDELKNELIKAQSVVVHMTEEKLMGRDAPEMPQRLKEFAYRYENVSPTLLAPGAGDVARALSWLLKKHMV